jgi:hypothetical protein
MTTLAQVYDALWDRISAMPDFKTKSRIWEDYTSAKNGHPAVYMRLVNEQVINDPVGLPARYQLSFEIFIKINTKSDPKTPGDRLLILQREKLIKALAPDPGSNLCHLGLGKGWVMHAWVSSAEYFTALQNDDENIMGIFGVQVLCATIPS